MTFSPLISGTIPHHNKFSSRNGSPITRLIQHHWAGTGGGIERMSDPNQQASCTYVVLSDGQILGHVPEEYRPWTSGSAEADTPSVTIEVQNTGGQVNGNDSDPSSWPISEAAYGAIVRLLIDVAQRHGWGAIDGNTYLGHRQFYQTACPGGFLWARMDQTRQLANQLLIGGIAAQGSINLASTGTPTEEGFLMALNDEAQDNIYKAIGRLDKAVADIYDRVFGRDVQRWYHPDNPGDVRTYAFPGSVAARSTDVNDVLSTNRIIEANTNKVLTALSGLPGIDAKVIADLREQLAAELKEATASLSVTLTVKDDK